MRKAVITGIFTGVIISLILIGASYARTILPDTFTANLFFMGFFFFTIAGVLWLSLNYYCRSSEVKWMTLSVTGVMASLIAAVIVSGVAGPLGYSFYHFTDLAVVLFLISLAIAGIYYVRNRNRMRDNARSKNQELIF